MPPSGRSANVSSRAFSLAADSSNFGANDSLAFCSAVSAGATALSLARRRRGDDPQDRREPAVIVASDRVDVTSANPYHPLTLRRGGRRCSGIPNSSSRAFRRERRLSNWAHERSCRGRSQSQRETRRRRPFVLKKIRSPGSMSEGSISVADFVLLLDDSRNGDAVLREDVLHQTAAIEAGRIRSA